MKHRYLHRLVGLMAFTCAVPSPAAAVDVTFKCHVAKRLASLLALGVDGVIDEIYDDPEGYANGTLEGGVCILKPLPPLKHGQPYLEGLQCFASDKLEEVGPAELSNAGEIYKREFEKVRDCFGSEITTATPTSITSDKTGESLIVALKRSARSANGDRRYILVRYGYYHEPGKPIIWETSALVGNTVPD